MDRLVKMFPAEIVVLYSTGAAIIPHERTFLLIVWSVVALVALVVLRATCTSAGKGPQWVAVAISAIAFVIWLYASGGPFVAFGFYDPVIGQLLVLAWTFLAPKLYLGTED